MLVIYIKLQTPVWTKAVSISFNQTAQRHNPPRCDTLSTIAAVAKQATKLRGLITGLQQREALKRERGEARKARPKGFSTLAWLVSGARGQHRHQCDRGVVSFQAESACQCNVLVV